MNENTLQARDKQELAAEGTRPGLFFRPDIDILEGSDGFVIYADVPGVDEQSVNVRFDRGLLVLDATPAPDAESDWTPLHAEYRSGGYHREFRISEDIDMSGVSATMRNGVLELRLPKSAERQPRTIAVQAG